MSSEALATVRSACRKGLVKETNFSRYLKTVNEILSKTVIEFQTAGAQYNCDEQKSVLTKSGSSVDECNFRALCTSRV